MAYNVVILGCGRSGTSIFGELFDALPAFEYHSEPLLADLRLTAGAGAIAVKVPRSPPSLTPPAGAPVHLHELFDVVPPPRVLFWQVRHPLDAICSLRVGISRGWAHHPRPPDWRDWQNRPLVERCAHHWAVVNTAGFALVRDIAVVNRFEDMIDDPQRCAVDAARRVDIDPAAVRADIDRWAQRVQNTDNEHFIEATTSRRHSRRDHSRRVGRWRENLTADDLAAAMPIVAEGAASFGYDLA